MGVQLNMLEINKKELFDDNQELTRKLANYEKSNYMLEEEKKRILDQKNEVG